MVEKALHDDSNLLTEGERAFLLFILQPRRGGLTEKQLASLHRIITKIKAAYP